MKLYKALTNQSGIISVLSVADLDAQKSNLFQSLELKAGSYLSLPLKKAGSYTYQDRIKQTGIIYLGSSPCPAANLGFQRATLLPQTHFGTLEQPFRFLI